MEGGVGGAVSSPASTPLTWNDFLDRMRQPSAVNFVKSIKSFIESFTTKVRNTEEDSASVQQFLFNMVEAFRAHPLWAGCSEEELESAGEGLEKYVMTKLFNHAFASNPDERKHDEELSEKMALVQQFIRPENLDIKPTFQNETSWLLAQKELQKINMYKAPRDKLVCILNCCKVINNLLLNASLSTSENHPGADEFLPVLIYVTIKANPPQLYSNLLYIQRYRRESHLVSEPAYYFTNIFSAESFIWNINAKTLSIDELEFQKNMESARALLPGISTNTDSITATSQTTHHDVKTERIKSKESQASENRKKLDGKVSDTAKSESVSVLETKGANDLLKEEELRKYFSEYQFLYASAGDLTVKDVENLLDNYKQLVLKYVSLLKGIGAFNPSFPSSLTEKSAETSNTREPNDVKESDRDSDKFDVFCKAVEDSISESPSDQTDQIMESNDHHEFPDADGNSSVNTWTEDSGMLGFNLSPTRVEEILNSDTIGNSITNISKDHGSLDSDSEKTQRSNEAAVP